VSAGNPRWQETILADHIKPAAVRAGIAGKVGWHTLRHTYSSLLRSLRTDVKVQQALLRHADVSTTLNMCTQAVSEQKREAKTLAGTGYQRFLRGRVCADARDERLRLCESRRRAAYRLAGGIG
jgi:hypothetical protein